MILFWNMENNGIMVGVVHTPLGNKWLISKQSIIHVNMVYQSSTFMSWILHQLMETFLHESCEWSPLFQIIDVDIP